MEALEAVKRLFFFFQDRRNWSRFNLLELVRLGLSAGRFGGFFDSGIQALAWLLLKTKPGYAPVIGMPLHILSLEKCADNLLSADGTFNEMLFPYDKSESVTYGRPHAPLTQPAAPCP